MGGGLLGWKMYTPARTVCRNPYPYWNKILAEIYTLTGTKPNKKST